ncbi:MAG: HsdR family type I site-specific deoxyribonuclease [Bacteroidota bacterium]
MKKSTLYSAEKAIQQETTQFFCEMLGYQQLLSPPLLLEGTYIRKDILTSFLTKQQYPAPLIQAALKKLTHMFQSNKRLFPLNKAFYEHLFYGVNIKMGPQTKARTLPLVDWQNLAKNHFHIAEEVSLPSSRIDLVLYLNGIPIGIIELKRPAISVEEAIAQNIRNQQKLENTPFFATLQLIMAGNTSQGIRYATTETSAKYYHKWHEEQVPTPKKFTSSLQQDLYHLCQKERLLDLIYNCVLFSPQKKVIARPHQYFALKAAQKSIQQQQGGIVFHTQGAGKSVIMVLLAAWLLRNDPEARVLLMVDRKDLGEQLKRNFQKNDIQVDYTKTAKNLFQKLSQSTSRVIATLIQKFRTQRDEETFYHFTNAIDKLKLTSFQPKGKIYILVDECHRSHAGKLHQAMKGYLPDALIIGFTGTPLLKKDKKNSIKCFGPYIHSYKYDRGVKDGVILDLLYEARSIPQELQDKAAVDRFFEEKTRHLTPKSKADLKKRWTTIQKIHSAHARLTRIAEDIILDMETRVDLQAGTANALLVASSILEAFRYYAILQARGFTACAVITSYTDSQPSATTTLTQDESAEKKRIYTQMITHYQKQYAGLTPDTFESKIKKVFKEKPAEIKLLIVVDKLLTGFDSPPTAYLYIDKKMQDHGLFQAVCRVNRLHTPDKKHGYIIDYKDLFKSLEKSIKNYTDEAFGDFDAEDVQDVLHYQLTVAKEHLKKARKSYHTLLKNIPIPHTANNQREYFCGKRNDKNALIETQPKRNELYTITRKLLRAYANIANQLTIAEYPKAEIKTIVQEVHQAQQLMQTIEMISGDQQDIRHYDSTMRHILDNYISAKRSKKITPFSDKPLLALIQTEGLTNTINTLGMDEQSATSALGNNAFRAIEKNKPLNPVYYQNLSLRLEQLLLEQQLGKIAYEVYLKQMETLLEDIARTTEKATHYPRTIKTQGQRTLYDNLDQDEALALNIHQLILTKKRDQWKKSSLKSRELAQKLEKRLLTLKKNGNLSPSFDIKKKMSIFGAIKELPEYE